MTRRTIEDIRLEQLNAEQSCDHGAMQRRAGINRAHKPFAGWFCPEDVCKPEWADIETVIGPALDAWAAR
jgi:hypothetical protein